MGAAVSIVDFDRDGWPDIYVTNSAEGSKNGLYRNNTTAPLPMLPRRWVSLMSISRELAFPWVLFGATTTTMATKICSLQVGQAGAISQRQRPWLYSRD